MKYKRIQPLVAHGSAVRTVYFVSLCCARMRTTGLSFVYFISSIEVGCAFQNTWAATGFVIRSLLVFRTRTHRSPPIRRGLLREICKNRTANIGLCSFVIGPIFHRHRWSHRVIHWEWQIYEWSVFAVLILQLFRLLRLSGLRPPPRAAPAGE